MQDSAGPVNNAEERALRSIAMSVAHMLPERREDALAVLRHAEWLIENFLHQTADASAEPARSNMKPGLRVV